MPALMACTSSPIPGTSTTTVTSDGRVFGYITDDKHKLDVDNLGKLVCDALAGKAWGDDCQVADMILRRRYDPDNPRTEVEIEEMAP